jgi:hypothetical protein
MDANAPAFLRKREASRQPRNASAGNLGRTLHVANTNGTRPHSSCSLANFEKKKSPELRRIRASRNGVYPTREMIGRFGVLRGVDAGRAGRAATFGSAAAISRSNVSHNIYYGKFIASRPLHATGAGHSLQFRHRFDGPIGGRIVLGTDRDAGMKRQIAEHRRSRHPGPAVALNAL